MGPAQFEAFGADLVRRLPTQPPGDVLEIACGTGIVTRRLRERLDPAVRLVATDLSRAMLDYARAKLAKFPGIEWREADGAALPFADAAFGAVVRVRHHVRSRQAVRLPADAPRPARRRHAPVQCLGQHRRECARARERRGGPRALSRRS